MWILTREHNAYDQEGEYYVYAWDHKPSKEEVDIVMDKIEDGYADLDHIMNGGGRKNWEDIWYNLFEQKEIV